MTASRYIPLSIHAGIETLLAPLVMAAPFMFRFDAGVTLICLLIGGLLLYLALQIPGPKRTVPLASHANYDYALAGFAALAGGAIGVITGNWTPAIFLVGFGLAQVALTALTRFSVPRGA